MIEDFGRIREVYLEGYQPEIGRVVWMLEAARWRLYECLAELDTAVLDWQPTHGGNSIGTLLYHIAAIEADWLYVEVLQQPFPAEIDALLSFDVRDADGRLTAVTNQSLAEQQHRLNICRAHLLTTYQEMSVADFRRLRQFDAYSVTPEWVLHHLIQHETEHRGQITEVALLALEKGKNEQSK